MTYAKPVLARPKPSGAKKGNECQAGDPQQELNSSELRSGAPLARHLHSQHARTNAHESCGRQHRARPWGPVIALPLAGAKSRPAA